MKPKLAPSLYLLQAGLELFKRGEWPRTELATEAVAWRWH